MIKKNKLNNNNNKFWIKASAEIIKCKKFIFHKTNVPGRVMVPKKSYFQATLHPCILLTQQSDFTQSNLLNSVSVFLKLNTKHIVKNGQEELVNEV